MNISRTFTVVLGLLALHGAALAAPEIASGATVAIKNNKAKNIVAVGGGGTAGKALGGLVKAGEVQLNGVANVNSLVVYDGKVKGTVTIKDNEADGVYAIGGVANVNSVILGKP